MSLTIEQELTKHELADERRFGQIERHLERIEGKIDVLVVRISGAEDTASKAEDKAEVTGSHNMIPAKNIAWIVLKSLGALCLVLLAAFVGHFVK